MFNCGMMAVELPGKVIDDLFKKCPADQTIVTTDLEKNIFQFEFNGQTQDISFSLSEFDRTLVNAGGWLEFADAKY